MNSNAKRVLSPNYKLPNVRQAQNENFEPQNVKYISFAQNDFLGKLSPSAESRLKTINRETWEGKVLLKYYLPFT